MLNATNRMFVMMSRMRFFVLIFCCLLNGCYFAGSSKSLQKTETIENVSKLTDQLNANAGHNTNAQFTVKNYEYLDQNKGKQTNSSYQTESRRTEIKFPADCTDIVPIGEEIKDLPRACAEAIKSIKPELQKAAKDEGCENSFAGLLSPEYAYAYEVKFYPFSTNKYLVMMRCSTGAYNEINVYLLYDESAIPAKAAILEFPSFRFEYDEDSDVAKKVEEVTVKTIGGRYFNPKTKELIVFVKARGIGDAGEYARYSFLNGKPKLEEFRAKFKWEGRGYQAGDVIKNPPKTWKRYYPK